MRARQERTLTAVTSAAVGKSGNETVVLIVLGKLLDCESLPVPINAFSQAAQMERQQERHRFEERIQVC